MFRSNCVRGTMKEPRATLLFQNATDCYENRKAPFFFASAAFSLPFSPLEEVGDLCFSNRTGWSD